MGEGNKFGLEACFDLLMLVAGIVIAGISLGYGFGSIERPGPGLYPFFVGVSIAAFALLLLISVLRAQARVATLGREGAVRLVLLTASLSLWILAMPLLGYVVATLLATYAMCKIMGLEGWWRPIAVSAGTALFIYLLFDLWLYIDLPRGILE